MEPTLRRKLLQTLRDSNLENVDAQMREDVAEFIKWQTATDTLMASDDSKTLTKACEELRMKLVLVAMTVDPLRKLATAMAAPRELYALEGADNEFADLPIIANRGGVISATFAQFYTVILLPRIDDDQNQDEVSAGIHEIYERMGSQPTWVIDFSQVRVVPYSLLGNLMGYHHLLQSRSGEMHICWLRNSALPQTAADRVRGFLSLKRIGEFWFSEGGEKGQNSE